MALTLKTQPLSLQLQKLSKEIHDAKDLVGLDPLYAAIDSLKVQIQQMEASLAVEKQALWELRHPVMATAQTMQQLVAQANTQFSNVFSKLPTKVDVEAVTQITAVIETIMQEWQSAVSSFQDLKVTALTKVPEVGPLFG